MSVRSPSLPRVCRTPQWFRPEANTYSRLSLRRYRVKSVSATQSLDRTPDVFPVLGECLLLSCEGRLPEYSVRLTRLVYSDALRAESLMSE